jgi:hypothetical protein
VEEALARGSVNGKPLGEKRETLEQWLQKIDEEREHDAKAQKIEGRFHSTLVPVPALSHGHGHSSSSVHTYTRSRAAPLRLLC